MDLYLIRLNEADKEAYMNRRHPEGWKLPVSQQNATISLAWYLSLEPLLRNTHVFLMGAGHHMPACRQQCFRTFHFSNSSHILKGVGFLLNPL